MEQSQLDSLVANTTEIDNNWYKPIRGRRYNVEAFDSDNTLVDWEHYVGIAKARKVAAEFRKEGYRVELREDATFDNNGKEITFQERTAREPNGHPAANGLITPNRQAALDRRNVRKALKRSYRQNGKTIHRSGDWSEKGSPFHQDYLVEVEKNGFTVYLNGSLIARGLKQEVAKAIFHYMNLGIAKSMSDFDIRLNGKAGE